MSSGITMWMTEGRFPSEHRKNRVIQKRPISGCGVALRCPLSEIMSGDPSFDMGIMTCQRQGDYNASVCHKLSCLFMTAQGQLLIHYETQSGSLRLHHGSPCTFFVSRNTQRDEDKLLQMLHRPETLCNQAHFVTFAFSLKVRAKSSVMLLHFFSGVFIKACWSRRSEVIRL